jgi:hypothetical protein
VGNKLFLRRQKAMPLAQVPYVSRGQSLSAITVTSGNSLLFYTKVQLPFNILDRTSKYFPKFKATGRRMMVKFNSPGEGQEPIAYLPECIATLTNYLVVELPGRYMVGLRIRKQKKSGR